MGYSLGVDLGTTFVAAALATDTGIEMFTLGVRSEVTPAAVYLREDGALVTGEAASGLRTVNSPDRVSREFKRRLGDPTPVVVGGQPYAVTELLGTLLRDVLVSVIDSEGGPPDRVVLTHPANWGPFRRALFEEVGKFAGLVRPMTVTEPEAAAARYASSRRLADGDMVAVYDLGGGTFDATVLRKVAGGIEIVGTPEGVERLGGVDFDEAILRHVDVNSGGALTELDMRDPQTTAALARLRQDCILAKETLSADTETTLPVFLPGRHFEVRIVRDDFEDMIRAQVESTIGALSRTLESAGVDPAELSAVLLVGGSSRIPLVARMVSAALGRPTAVDTHPKYAVALGAATLAARAPLPSAGTMLAPPIPAQPAAPPVPLPATPIPPMPAQAPPTPPTPPMPPQPAAAPMPPQAPQIPQAPQLPQGSQLPMQAPAPPVAPRPQAPQPPGPGQQSMPPELHHPGPGQRSMPPPNAPARQQRRTVSLRQTWLRVLAAAALVIALGATAFVVLKPGSGADTGTTGAAEMVLTKSEVAIGDSYFITATGFTPGEPVQLSWTGPTNGVMDASPADTSGVRTHGPVIEQDPPGNYVIIATGLTSGQTARAELEVLPAQ